MNMKEAFDLIKDVDWILENLHDDYGTTLSLGYPGSGVLMFHFEANGDISFPSKMGFLPPEYKRWSFNEELQKYEIWNSVEKLHVMVNVPIEQGNRTVMKFEGEDIRLVSFPDIYRLLNQPIAEAPIFQTGSIILAYDYQRKTALEEIAFQAGCPVHRLHEDPAVFEGMQEIFDFLISHPKLTKIAIVESTDYDKNPFDFYEPGKLTFSGEEMMLVADRIVFIEMFGSYLVELNHESFSEKMMHDYQHEIDLLPFWFEIFGSRMNQI